MNVCVAKEVCVWVLSVLCVSAWVVCVLCLVRCCVSCLCAAWCVACGMVYYGLLSLFSSFLVILCYSHPVTSPNLEWVLNGARRNERTADASQPNFENRSDGTNFQQCCFHPAMLTPAMLTTSWNLQVSSGVNFESAKLAAKVASWMVSTWFCSRFEISVDIFTSGESWGSNHLSYAQVVVLKFSWDELPKSCLCASTDTFLGLGRCLIFLLEHGIEDQLKKKPWHKCTAVLLLEFAWLCWSARACVPIN